MSADCNDVFYDKTKPAQAHPSAKCAVLLVAGSHKKLAEMGLSKIAERIGLTFTDLSLFDNLNLYHDYILVNLIPTKLNNRA